MAPTVSLRVNRGIPLLLARIYAKSPADRLRWRRERWPTHGEVDTQLPRATILRPEATYRMFHQSGEGHGSGHRRDTHSDGYFYRLSLDPRGASPSDGRASGRWRIGS